MRTGEGFKNSRFSKERGAKGLKNSCKEEKVPSCWGKRDTHGTSGHWKEWESKAQPTVKKKKTGREAEHGKKRKTKFCHLLSEGR